MHTDPIYRGARLEVGAHPGRGSVSAVAVAASWLEASRQPHAVYLPISPTPRADVCRFEIPVFGFIPHSECPTVGTGVVIAEGHRRYSSHRVDTTGVHDCRMGVTAGKVVLIAMRTGIPFWGRLDDFAILQQKQVSGVKGRIP